MPYYIALGFDFQSNSLIYPYWADLVEYNSLIFEKEFPPHISLLVCKDLDVNAVINKLKEISHLISQFLLSFEKIERFEKPGDVIYLKPANIPTLSDIHTIIIKEVGPLCNGLNDLYLPKKWIPHSTIGIKIPPEMVEDAYHFVLKRFSLFKVGVENLYLGEYDLTDGEKWRFTVVLNQKS